MKTKPDHDELLNEVLSESAPQNFREASLLRTLTSARRHRRTRSALHVVGATGICFALLAGVIWHQRNSSSTANNRPESVAPIQASAPTVPGTNIRLVSDDELLAMFPDRPVALLGPPDKRQFVFLDEHRAHPGRTVRHKDQL